MNRVISFFRVSSANYAPINYRFGSTTYQRHFQQRKPFPTAFVIPYSRHNNPQPNMVNSYNYPDGVSCQLFFFLLAVGARRDLNLAHRLPVDSNSFCKSNPKRNRCRDRIRAVPGEDRRASQILANLAQTSPLFFCYFFRLARRRKGGTGGCPKPRGNPFSTPHQGRHV